MVAPRVDTPTTAPSASRRRTGRGSALLLVTVTSDWSPPPRITLRSPRKRPDRSLHRGRCGDEPMTRVLVVGSINMDLVVETATFPRLGETLFGTAFATHPG